MARGLSNQRGSTGCCIWETQTDMALVGTIIALSLSKFPDNQPAEITIETAKAHSMKLTPQY